MKSTGIIRRLDDLGRIVIPKEIRNSLKIREGNNLEILVNANGELILKKYSNIKQIGDISNNICDALYNVYKFDTIITDLDNVISCSKRLKFQNKEIGSFLENLILKKECFISNVSQVNILKDLNILVSVCFCPVFYNGDIIGSVNFISNVNNLGEKELNTLRTVSSFLTKYLEE